MVLLALLTTLNSASPCNHPKFSFISSWLAPLAEACCRLLRLGGCGQVTEQVLGCQGFWGSIAFPIALACLGAVLLSMVLKACWELRHAMSSERGSSAAQQAGDALSALKAAAPSEYPPASHAWTQLEVDKGAAQVLYCTGCHKPIGSPTFYHSASACAACGAVAHDSCLRGLGDSCRPLCLAKATHWWQVPGAVLQTADKGTPSASLPCHLCQQGCGLAPVTPEPTWQCGFCAAAVHVQCWCNVHGAAAPGVAGALRSRGADAQADESLSDSCASSLASTDTEDEEWASPMRRRTRELRRRQRRIAERDMHPLDACRPSGPASGAVLLPWSVEAAPGHDGADPGSDAESLPDRGRGWWRPRRRPKPRPLRREGLRVSAARLPAGCRPVLAFVNTKSGAQAGTAFRQRLLRSLHPLQVVQLPREDPVVALRPLLGLPGLRVLVIGGDGTVSWVLSAIDDATAAATGGEAVGDDEAPPAPPVGIIPLGTGNDLARVLGWGAGAAGWLDHSALGLLEAVEHAAPVHVDRWRLRGERREGEGGSGGKGNRPAKDGEGDDTLDKTMTNYLGIGTDAGVALGFHRMREGYPNLFGSQLGNKLLYTWLGAQHMLSIPGSDLSDLVQVEADGKPLELPAGIQGLMLLNINSFMGGVDLWATSSEAGLEQTLQPQRLWDGKLELAAVFGIWHLGKLQIGLDSAIRLCQCSELSITLTKSMPMQVDGEASQQPAGTFTVSRQGQVPMLQRVHPALASVVKAVTDVLDDAREDEGISRKQHAALSSAMATALQDKLDPNN
uniref:Diacylglycerol kinase n=1 Tax=Auxenochlorella protothecoides TaxID=3075 RepID=A0A1D2A372_AUXPR